MQLPTHTATLGNGIRLVVQEVPGPPVVAVVVQYGIGFRNEPRDSPGFAHLFEHMMFQGSSNVPQEGHFSLVQEAGGVANGNTYQDHTEFHQVVPSSALDRILFMEADRLRSLSITQQGLRTQIGVVREEIRANVLNRPYGGFPWTVLPGALYREWSNSHNGYGDLDGLARATVARCQDFFDHHYTPANTVISLCGRIDPAEAEAMVERHFGDIPPRVTAATQDLSEPDPTVPRTVVHRDALAAMPATAFGYRLPEAATEMAAYAAHIVLSNLLTGGHDALLKERVDDISSGCGFFGPLNCADPDTFLIVATHEESRRAETAATIRATLETLADGRVDPARVDSAACRATAAWHRSMDSLLTRASRAGVGQLLFGDPQKASVLADSVSGVTAPDIAAAARRMAEQPVAAVHLIRQ